jgi:hypothetical protein
VPLLAALASCGPPAARPAADPAPAPAAATDDDAAPPLDFVTDWASLEPRVHAILRGELTLAPGTACAIAPPVQLCTPTADVVGWHATYSFGAGDDQWIVTERVGGVERIAVALAVMPGVDALDDDTRAMLADQYRCGQLGRFWGALPDEDVACSADADCRLITSTCFTVAVAEDAAAPYLDVHARVGGPCLHPAGGVCAPSTARAACQGGRCTHVD